MTVNLSAIAEAQLAALPIRFRLQVRKHIDRLEGNPFPKGSKKLEGTDVPTWRIRAGNYRVLYSVGGGDVFVTGIGDRKDVYRRLSPMRRRLR